MSVLIKGMEMPDCGYVCLKVFTNGEVLMTKEHRGALVITGIKDKVGTAVPVPKHGRLIDADAIRADIDEKRPGRNYEDAWALTVMDAAPTIIPADPAEEEGE